jgi:protein-tyrosine-phosphatase
VTHVLFVCLHNAGRSQISQALFERAAAGRHSADSAGSVADPNGHVHPEVVQVMRELGIDLADRRPQRLTDQLAEHADVIVAMGCGDSCPYFPGKRYVDWELPDPRGQPVAAVRALRDEIARRVAALVGELDVAEHGAEVVADHPGAADLEARPGAQGGRVGLEPGDRDAVADDRELEA